MKSLICALALAVLFSAAHAAGADCCDCCGCQASCRQVCRLVREVKKVPKVSYDCECEDFCVPGKSECSIECDACGNEHKVYTPTCGKLRTRTRLVKRETMEEKVVYKWVVENVCCSCAAKLPQTAHDAPLAANGAPRSGNVNPTSFGQSMLRANQPAPAAERLPASSRFDLRRVLSGSAVDALADDASAQASTPSGS